MEIISLSLQKITQALSLGPGADQDPDHEAGRVEGGARDQRGQWGQHHLLSQ